MLRSRCVIAVAVADAVIVVGRVIIFTQKVEQRVIFKMKNVHFAKWVCACLSFNVQICTSTSSNSAYSGYFRVFAF